MGNLTHNYWREKYPLAGVKKITFPGAPGQVEFQAGQAYIFTQCPADK